MNFKIDENLPAELVTDLRDAGHDAETVSDEGLAGIDDPDLLQHVRDEQRALLTMDKGIADIRVYPPEAYAGLVLFRPHQTGRRAVLEFARRYLSSILAADLSGRLLIISEAGIRIR